MCFPFTFVFEDFGKPIAGIPIFIYCTMKYAKMQVADGRFPNKMMRIGAA